MNAALDSIVEQLAHEHDELMTMATTARKDLSELESKLARISSAREILEGKAMEHKAVNKRKATSRSASTPQVVEFIVDELAKHGTLHQEQLKARTKNRITEAGYSLLRFSSRFEDALADCAIIETPSGFAMKSSARTKLGNGGVVTTLKEILKDTPSTPSSLLQSNGNNG